MLCKRFYIVFLILSIFSAGCTTVTHDGPPDYPVDVTKIPDAIPKLEPPSKIGNKISYKVFGKRYYVMKSSNNYSERGTASWYGKKFHQRQTTSGEPYDMLAMTAAHKTLPLPTYVEVTNLNNGKKVIVKVNDRGPFSGNRIIDLSYAAAKKLGMANHGVAKVEIRALNPIGSPITVPVPAPVLVAKNPPILKPIVQSPIYLQIGAFSNKLNAEKFKNEVARLISLPVQITSLATAKKLYRVQIGPLHDPKTVSEVNKQLKSLRLNGKPMVV